MPDPHVDFDEDSLHLTFQLIPDGDYAPAEKAFVILTETRHKKPFDESLEYVALRGSNIAIRRDGGPAREVAVYLLATIQDTDVLVEARWFPPDGRATLYLSEEMEQQAFRIMESMIHDD